jgi:dethiobiotin synthetase
MMMLLLEGAPANPSRTIARHLQCSIGLRLLPQLIPAAGTPAPASSTDAADDTVVVAAADKDHHFKGSKNGCRFLVLFGDATDHALAILKASQSSEQLQLLGVAVRLRELSQLPHADEQVVTAEQKQAVRIFVTGDRSQVGKSTVCLGLLGALQRCCGLKASELAYIKPATQCEAPQLVGRYCAAADIAAVPIGPIVYYSGFTRAFLAGDTKDSEKMLTEVEEACAALGRGRKVLVVDGVGYPGVGSITGTSNAAVARRLDAKVLVVGKRGVGDAVDSYCMNRAMFELAGVPVMGGVFNRLAEDENDYYSLDKCAAAVGRWFAEQPDAKHQKCYGFLPEMEFPSGAASSAPKGTPPLTAFEARELAETTAAKKSVALGDAELAAVQRWIRVFASKVDVATILKDAKRVERPSINARTSASCVRGANTPEILVDTRKVAASRAEIQATLPEALQGGG